MKTGICAIIICSVALAGCRTHPGSSVASPVAVNNPAESQGEYVIKPGDTVAKIAFRHGLSVPEFMALNPGLDPRRLLVDQRVKIRKDGLTQPTVGGDGKLAPQP